MKRAAVVVALLSVLSIARVCAAGVARDDAYLAGYAAAVLERELRVHAPSLTVREGVVTVDARDLAGADTERVTSTLAGVPGVVRVELLPGGAAADPPPAGEPGPRAATEAADRRHDFQIGLLPGRLLFRPLIADPRWPHFAASYQYYVDEGDITHVGAVSFGGSVAQAPTAGTPVLSVVHSEDLVPALGGSGVAADGRLIVERGVDASPTLEDPLPAHALTAYRGTARLVDGSEHPRVEEFRDLVDEVTGGAPARTTAWHAEREPP